MAGFNGLGSIEERYGPLGSGQQSLTIRGAVYTVADLLVRLSLNFDDSRAIDALPLPHGRYVFRYHDGQDQRVVALEFDADFRCLGEMRGVFPQGTDPDDYAAQYCGH